jgi:hypothetical protein
MVRAQAPVTADGPITYAHHHLNVTSVQEHKRFWIDTLGGTSVGIGSTENVKFPGVLVRLRKEIPTGGTKGTTVNHIGFQVSDVRQTVNNVKAAGYPIVTATEVTTAPVQGDIAFIANQNTNVAFVMGPDNTKVELFENRALTVPIALHHVHFAAQNVPEMTAWYVKTFNGTPGRAGSFETVELPGVSLRWGSSADSLVGTKGRVLDHIGFEVTGLQNFCKRLQAMGVKFDRPFGKAADSDFSNAFIVDPWGTYIELTEGLDKYWKKN